MHAWQQQTNSTHRACTPTYLPTRRYVGDWVSECATGFGKFTHANGNTYEGEWLDDKRHGACGVGRWWRCLQHRQGDKSRII